MKKITFRTVVSNKSHYPIDIVWENAKDLEHVGFLHRKTNFDFKLLNIEKSKSSGHEYDQMIYRASRKLVFFKFQSMGFRKIIQKYNLRQMEYIPLLGITTCLNSLLYPAPEGENYKTQMVDEVIMEIPFILSFLVPYFKKALKRHTAIQCLEDEPFRERRQLLKNKGIHFPFSVFNEPHFQTLTAGFELKAYAPAASHPLENRISEMSVW